jgi:hypothetical protein
MAYIYTYQGVLSALGEVLIRLVSIVILLLVPSKLKYCPILERFDNDCVDKKFLDDVQSSNIPTNHSQLPRRKSKDAKIFFSIARTGAADLNPKPAALSGSTIAVRPSIKPSVCGEDVLPKRFVETARVDGIAPSTLPLCTEPMEYIGMMSHSYSSTRSDSEKVPTHSRRPGSIIV